MNETNLTLKNNNNRKLIVKFGCIVIGIIGEYGDPGSRTTFQQTGD